MRKFLMKLYREGEKVVESESFRGLHYAIKDGHIVFISEKNGTFCLNMDCVNDFITEIKDILEVWKDIKTKNCFISNEKQMN